MPLYKTTKPYYYYFFVLKKLDSAKTLVHKPIYIYIYIYTLIMYCTHQQIYRKKKISHKEREEADDTPKKLL